MPVDGSRGNRATVEIMNESYTLVGDSSPEYIQRIAEFVDMDLQDLRRRQPRLARNRLLVLALLNSAERFFHEQKRNDRLQDELRKAKRELHRLHKSMEDGKERGGR